MENRRNYTRIAFNCPATLYINAQPFGCELLDLSLKGALVSCPDSLAAKLGESIKLVVELAPDDAHITLHTELAHQEQNQLGLYITQLDLTSAAHLKRIIELNTTEPEQLQHELARLSELSA